MLPLLSSSNSSKNRSAKNDCNGGDELDEYYRHHQTARSTCVWISQCFISCYMSIIVIIKQHLCVNQSMVYFMLHEYYRHHKTAGSTCVWTSEWLISCYMSIIVIIKQHLCVNQSMVYFMLDDYYRHHQTAPVRESVNGIFHVTWVLSSSSNSSKNLCVNQCCISCYMSIIVIIKHLKHLCVKQSMVYFVLDEYYRHYQTARSTCVWISQ